MPNGQEVISIVGGLELNTPVWANEQHEFPYLQWQMEVHRAKLKAAFPHAADKIQTGGPAGADDIYARATRVAVAQGMPTTHPGDALFNLVTFSRTWIRPWAFYAIEDTAVRDALLRLFPDGCYVAFAGDTYCESRNESMDDCWRVMHALPGDGQNRPSVGESLIEVQERYNTLSNIQAETYEYGIPPIYADPQVLDFDALQGQTAEPAAHYPARARPGMSLADGFFQPAPAQVPPDMLRHQQDLIGPIAQFLTGLFPAVFGGEMENVKTASGYAMARDQALGRLGLVWRRLKQFYGDVMLLSRRLLPQEPAERRGDSVSRRGRGIRGELHSPGRSEGQYPGAPGIRRDVSAAEIAAASRAAAADEPIPIPTIQATLREPANFGFIKSLIGLERAGGAGRRRAQQAVARDSAIAGVGADCCARAAARRHRRTSLAATMPASETPASAFRSPPFRWTNCSTITPRNSRSAAAGPVPTPGRSRARRIPRGSPTCARTPPNTPPCWRGSRLLAGGLR